ncbi:MAG: nucleotide exchange factor GrpE [Clostridia bacterium]|nr:nucleotide exchange factor GrpE [Clostridia bacterium]
MSKDQKKEKPVQAEPEAQAQTPAVEETPAADETAALQKALDEKNDQFLRLCAEYDNFRKRSQKEKQELYNAARADVIKELLPVLDNFDRAAGNRDASAEDYKKGVELIHTQLGEILKKIGVAPFGAAGEAFDPQIHNAVMTVEDEAFGENEIAEVFSMGYKLGDKVIREAVVKVANT